MSSSGLGLGGAEIWGDTEAAALEAELADLTTAQILNRTSAQEGNARHNRGEVSRLQRDIAERKAEVKDNLEKIKTNKVLPYLVANVVEVRGGRARAPGLFRARSRAHAHAHAHSPQTKLLPRRSWR